MTETKTAEYVNYGNDTITIDELARVKFVLSTLVTRERGSVLAKRICVNGVTCTVDEVDAVLSLAQGMWFRLANGMVV